jgi:hypothetical protein
MLASPPCPDLLPGRPFIQLDFGRACWATETLSPSGLRAWLRLLTHYRNDRPIPRLSERRLARIAGLSSGAAHKVLKELQAVLVFSGAAASEDEAEAPATAPARGAHDMNAGCSRDERGADDGSSGCSQHEQKGSQRERQCSRNEHCTISSKEEIQERKNPPPTSSSAAEAARARGGHDEEEGSSAEFFRGGEASSQPAALPSAPRRADPISAPEGEPRTIDPRLDGVAAELAVYWASKRGARTPLAFAAQQAQLIEILQSPIGGIEAVRQQLQTAAMKDWDFIRHQTWRSWRLQNPEPLLLTEIDRFHGADRGSSRPGLRLFEARYRATYGKNSPTGDVLRAYDNWMAKAQHQSSLRDLEFN